MSARPMLGLAALLLATGAAAPLRMEADTPAELNRLFRQGDIAAHLAAKPGKRPRLSVAFPAGNSGAALMFAETASPVAWRIPGQIRPVREGELTGIEAEIAVDASRLTIARAVLGSVRVIREAADGAPIPAELSASPHIAGATVAWRRPRLDGRSAYAATLTVLNGRAQLDSGGAVRLAARPGETLRLRVRALTGDPPLHPLDHVLTPRAAADPLLRATLDFLASMEKLLAGSWRYNTYFGRDTLMTLRLLGPAAHPELIEAGLASVLERLDANGEVAHEEEIGEFALIARRRDGEPPSAAPRLDYKMVDDDFMLAPAAADYLLSPAGKERARAFLQRKTASGETYGDALLRNLRFVLRAARPFAERPGAERLIALKPGQYAGNWRDSADGLGGGRYPFDVNAALAPAALGAIARLAGSGLLGQALDGEEAARMARIWAQEAPPLFQVAVGGEEAARAARLYAASIGVRPAAPGADLRFRALALDAAGRPIPVMNSDEGFRLLFTDPPAPDVIGTVETLLRPFPAGLLSDAGLLVANPAFAGPAAWPRFGPNRYHGAVVWSWQQALLAAGIARQIARPDLSSGDRARLCAAQYRLWRVIDRTREQRARELWSWRADRQGAMIPVPFGGRAADETEANAAQLWSTVYLGVRPAACG